MDENSEHIPELEKFLKECQVKTETLEKLRNFLFKNETASHQNFHLVFMRMHNRLENSLDRILSFYIGSQKLEEESMEALFAQISPSEALKNLIFNFGFDNKLNLVHEIFPTISESSKQSLKTLNKIRNGLAHRYGEDHRYFLYKKKNIIRDPEGLKEFLNSLGHAMEEIGRVENAIIGPLL